MKTEVVGYFETSGHIWWSEEIHILKVHNIKYEFNIFTLRSVKRRVENMTTSQSGSTGQTCRPMIDENAVSDGNHGNVALLKILSDVQKK
jgi:hypothetical protein